MPKVDSFLKSLNVAFDNSGKVTLSKENFLSIIAEIKLGNVFSENKSLPHECYVIVDKSLNDFYPFPIEELSEWEKDGSFEKGDYLYKMILLKRI